jgi:hypothetical protein
MYRLSPRLRVVPVLLLVTTAIVTLIDLPLAG